MVTCQQLFQTRQGDLGIKGERALGPTLPNLCRLRSNPAALVLHPCPSGKDLSRAGGAGALALSPLRGSCRVLAHGSQGHMAFCPSLSSSG